MIINVSSKDKSTSLFTPVYGEGKRINWDQISYVGKQGRKVTNYSVVPLYKIP